ncbi:MAG: Gldg family protein [Bacteroidales bacterium]|jgi:gliding-associated putative ABC transporter substrate-binding component GldG
MKKTTTFLIAALGIIVLVNILADNFFFRMDLTSDHRYTLSKASKNIVKGLKEPVTISAYFSNNVPAELARTKRDFKEMLVEYANLSKGQIVYEFIDPSKDQETEQKAMSAGIQPVIANIREKDQVKQQKVYLGAVIAMGEESENIPFMQPGAAMEYALSSAIKKISVKNKPAIGIIQGHGEPGIAAMSQVYTALNVLYEVEPVFITDTTKNLAKFNTIALIAPKDTIPPSHLAQLDEFLARGGKMLIAINRVEGKLEVQRGLPVNTGLETWLMSKGLLVENNFVVDNRCASINVRQQQGMFTYNTQVKFPYLPLISKFADHPITKGLEAVLLPFASTIVYTGDTTKSFVPIAQTSEMSGTQATPTYFDVSKQWGPADFPMKGLTVAGVLTGKIVGQSVSTIVLIGDGDFAVNGEGEGARQQSPDNISFMVNSVDFLSDDTGLIELRTKGVTNRPIKQMEDGKKAFLKYFNFLLPLLLVIIYGIFRSQYNRNLRNKRMEEGHV